MPTPTERVPAVLSCGARVGGKSVFGAPPMIPVCSTLVGLHCVGTGNNMATVRHLTGRHSRVICSRVSHGGLFINATRRNDHSEVGVAFILGPRCTRLRTRFLSCTADRKVMNVGNRQSINNFHTSYCGTVSLSNYGTLIGYVRRFRTARWRHCRRDAGDR